MKIVNTLDHPVNLLLPRGTVTFPPAGMSFRLRDQSDPIRGLQLDGEHIPMARKWSPEYGIPEEKDGVLYIVSTVFAKSYPYRRDFIVPTDMVYDPITHKPKGCRAFGIYFTGDVEQWNLLIAGREAIKCVNISSLV